MLLSNIPQQFASAARDGEFSRLGFVSHSGTGMLTFVEDRGYLAAASDAEHVTCVLTTEELAPLVPARCGVAIAAAPRMAFYLVHNYLAEQTDFYGRPFETEVASGASVHPRAFVAPRNVRIGAGAVLEPGAIVLEGSDIGPGVILRGGAVIGAQGFEFKRIEGGILPVAHAGGVRLGERVEVQAGSTVARAVFGGHTEIGADTKLDSLVHIAHHVRVGRRCLIGARSGVAGSSVIGDDVWIGPGATISNGITIGDGASVSIGSVVVWDVAAGQRVSGNFAVDHPAYMRFVRGLVKQEPSAE